MANLANFAYDPYNYIYMKQLNIVVDHLKIHTVVGFIYGWIK